MILQICYNSVLGKYSDRSYEEERNCAFIYLHRQASRLIAIVSPGGQAAGS